MFNIISFKRKRLNRCEIIWFNHKEFEIFVKKNKNEKNDLIHILIINEYIIDSYINNDDNDHNLNVSYELKLILFWELNDIILKNYKYIHELKHENLILNCIKKWSEMNWIVLKK